MFILFGTRGVTTTPEEGQFYCPSCQTKREYGLKRVRRFFTLFFIPLIPLDKLGEYVECKHCKNTYNPSVLGYDPEAEAAAFQSQYYAAAKHVMVKMMLADGEADKSEVIQMQKHMEALFGTYIDDADMLAEIEQAKNDGQDIESYIQNIAPNLNVNDKEKILMAAVSIALADGNFDNNERNLVIRLGKAMGLTNAHINGVIMEAEAQ